MTRLPHLLLLLFTPALLHHVFFNPGSATTLDFFEMNPTIQTSLLYKEHCIQANCSISVIHNFNQKVSDTSTFTVLTVNQEGAYILAVKSGDIGFIMPATVNLTASYLCMQTPEEYLSRQLPLTYKRGRTVVVPCPIQGVPQPTVTWSRRDASSNIYQDIQVHESKYTITKLGHLFIYNFTDSDVGRYSCTAKNSCGERCGGETDCSGVSAQSNDYELFIEDEITSNDTDKLLRIKYYFLNPRNIDCWIDECFKYGKDSNVINLYIEPQQHVNVEVLAYMNPNAGYTGAKMITGHQSPNFISHSDAICYGELLNYTYKDVRENSVRCRVMLDSGLVAFSVAYYSIAIREPPHISFTKPASVTYGSDFTLVFSITKGHFDNLHKPMVMMQVTCFKNGEPFQLDDGWHKKCLWDRETNEVRIKVACATVTDTGYYQVQAMNRAGTRISEPAYIDTLYHAHGIDIVIHCFPLDHVVLSATSVRLSWVRPTTNQTALVYEVKIQNTMWEEDIPPIHTVKTVHVVERLHPGTVYHAVVVSKGDLVGHRITFQTHQRRPTAAPTSMACNSVIATTKLKCVWDKIPMKERNGHIEMYHVKYRSHNTWLMNETTMEFMELEDLDPFTVYTVQVAGCTLDGCGPAQEVEQETLEDVPARPAIRYTLPGVNNIRIGWERPYGSYKSLVYKVSCRDGQSDEIIFSKDNISDVDAVIAGSRVKSGTLYVVSIRPHNTQGYGPVLTEEISTLSGARGKLGLSCAMRFIFLWPVILYFNVV